MRQWRIRTRHTNYTESTATRNTPSSTKHKTRYGSLRSRQLLHLILRSVVNIILVPFPGLCIDRFPPIVLLNKINVLLIIYERVDPVQRAEVLCKQFIASVFTPQSMEDIPIFESRA